ncbi:MAG TPA: response regulator [Pyrinomonadaceae bacterium]
MSSLPAMHTSASRRPGGSKVLVAEDHDDTRLLLRTLLERRGYAVVEAADGIEACDVAARERPDLILMDGGLPLLDGVAATRRMRRLGALSRVPIVFLSGHAGPQYQVAARDAGCDDYVVKPFDIARLDNILNFHLPPGGRKRTKGSDSAHMTCNALSSAAQKLYGLIEIDQAGTVLYTRFEGEGADFFSARDFTGRNFYAEVAPFKNVAEFRQRLDDFKRGTHAAHSINFTCEYADGPLAVRVLLTRIRERTERDVTKSILVHIRGAH